MDSLSTLIIFHIFCTAVALGFFYSLSPLSFLSLSSRIFCFLVPSRALSYPRTQLRGEKQIPSNKWRKWMRSNERKKKCKRKRKRKKQTRTLTMAQLSGMKQGSGRIFLCKKTHITINYVNTQYFVSWFTFEEREINLWSNFPMTRSDDFHRRQTERVVNFYFLLFTFQNASPALILESI